MGLFKKDLAQEKILTAFLDRHYLKAGLITERIHNKDLQHKGVDLILKGKNGLGYKVDEKAQLHYLNRSLPTFALEISYLKKGALKQGWLFDSKKLTEYYAFVFSIQLNNDLKELKRVEDIQSCDVIFVSRLKLLIELSKNNLDYNVCIKQNEVLRQNDSTSKIQFEGRFNIQISKHLEEQPVNLIVRKTFLKSIGRQHFFRP